MKAMNNIKRIVNTYGSFSIADVQAESSPCIGSVKGAIEVAEHFYEEGVDAVTYELRHDTEIGSEFVPYEDLDDEVIWVIEALAIRWEEISLEE